LNQRHEALAFMGVGFLWILGRATLHCVAHCTLSYRAKNSVFIQL